MINDAGLTVSPAKLVSVGGMERKKSDPSWEARKIDEGFFSSAIPANIRKLVGVSVDVS